MIRIYRDVTTENKQGNDHFDIPNTDIHTSDRFQSAKETPRNQNEAAEYAVNLSREYLQSKLSTEDTNDETTSLIQAYQPPQNLSQRGSCYTTNQSIHVRCAWYINWVKKAFFYRELERQLLARGYR